MKKIALLLLRLVLGTLMIGHGSQKLFGWFGGAGLRRTGESMEKLGLRPGKFWGTVAAIGEVSGGTLTTLGFLHPIGPQNVAASMIVATRRAHWRLPIFAKDGGAELPLTNLSLAVAMMLLGPGKYSLDRVLGIRLPKLVVALSYLGTAAITAMALFRPEAVRSTLRSSWSSTLKRR